jgi:GNAT superfamily N-acetyltransferase
MEPAVIQKLRILRGGSDHLSLFAECLALVDRTQGKGFCAPDYFGRCASGEGDRVLFIALLEGKLAGVATARVLPEEGFEYYVPFGREAVERLFQQHKVGSMEIVSVAESLQGKGIGQELTRHLIRWFSAAGCTAVIGVSWESGLPNTSDRVFRKLGCERLSQVKGFFIDISVRRGFICPVCGSPPCRCSASLFVKYIDPVACRTPPLRIVCGTPRSGNGKTQDGHRTTDRRFCYGQYRAAG